MDLIKYKTLYFLLVIYILSGCRSHTQNKSISDLQQSNDLGQKNLYDLTPSQLWESSDDWDHSGLNFLLSETKALGGDIQGAKVIVDSMVGEEPTEYLYFKSLTYDLVLGGSKEGMEKAKVAVVAYPRSARLQTIMSKYFFVNKQLDSGTTSLKHAIALDSSVEANYMSLLGVYRSKGEDKNYQKTLDQLVKKVPSSAFGHFELAKRYLGSRSSVNKALYHSSRAYAAKPNNPEIILLYALSLEATGKKEEALWHYENFYNYFSDRPQMMGQMLGIYAKMGQITQMKKMLDTTIKNSPRKVAHQAKVQKAYLLWSEGRIREASEIFLQVAAEQPSDLRLSYMVGLGLEEQGRVAEALRVYDQLIKKNFMKSQVELRRSILLYKIGQRNNAIESLQEQVDQQKIAQNPHLSILASFYKESFGAPRAEKFLLSQYKKSQNNREVLLLLGHFQYESGKVKKSILTVKKILNIDANDSEALNFVGYTLVEQGKNLGEAEKYLQRAIKIKPNDGYYLDSLGWLLYKKGRYHESLVYLLRSAKALPNTGVVLYHVGAVFDKLGKVEQAKEFLSRALKLTLEGQDRISAQKTLDRIDKR